MTVLPRSDRECETSELSEIGPGTADRQGSTCPADAARPLRRAVLLQAPEGAPVEWVQGVANLLAAPAPMAWKAEAWKVLQDDALAFLQQWAAQAHRLGWAGLDLFGVHPTAPVARLDGMGLVVLLQGRPVVALTEDSATIKAASGRTLTYRRHPCPPAGRCLVWNLLRTLEADA